MELLVSSVTIHSILIFKKNNASIVLRIKFMIYKLRGVYFVLWVLLSSLEINVYHVKKGHFGILRFNNARLAIEARSLILKHKLANVLKINTGLVKHVSNAIYQNILILPRKNVYIVQQGWLLILLNQNVRIAHLKIHGLTELNVLHVFILATGIKLLKIVSHVLVVESIIMQLIHVNVKPINFGLVATVLNATFQDISMIIVNSV